MSNRLEGAEVGAGRKFDRASFRSPEAKYGIHPFWFWNGAMEDAEIVRQIEEMAAARLGGFFICPRQGLQVPYLSDAWFAKVRLAVETAARHGLEVWLYDEYPYPSGIAGGEVTLEHPEAKQYTLQHRTAAVAGGEVCELALPWARLLSARAVPVEAGTGRRDWSRALDVSRFVGNHQAEPVFQKVGLTAYNRKRFFTYETEKRLVWTAPADGCGETEAEARAGAELEARAEAQAGVEARTEAEAGWSWEVHCYLEQEIGDFKYYGTFVDPCNEEAMATFIALTHERYAQELGEHFGTTIKGVFTDEIGLLGELPWSPRLPEAFRIRNGYDLVECIHALHDAEAEDAAKVRYDYYQTVHELLRSSYHKQVHDWCERYGLQYAAEVPSVRMTTQLYSHVPSGDSGHEKLGRPLDWVLNRYADSLRYNPKMISSLANQLSRERVLIECFHSVGWSMTLQDARWMIDRLAALGANFYNFHAFFYTLDGLTKHDAPPSQFLQNPYWVHFAALGNYVRRISYALSRGKADRPVAIVDPTTTFWTHLGNPFHEFKYGGKNESERRTLERLKAGWIDICKTLTLSLWDFDHLDPELLAEAAVEGGVLRIGDAAYEAVVLPPLTNLEQGAWRKLVAFREAGGLVVAVGELPSELLRPADTVPAEMRAALTPIALPELTAALAERLPPAVRLEAQPRTLLMHRRLLGGGASLIFLTHQEDGWIAPTLCIGGAAEARSGGASEEAGGAADGAATAGVGGAAGGAATAEVGAMRFELLDLETGEASPLTAERGAADGEWRVKLELAPYASVLVYAAPVSVGRVTVPNNEGGVGGISLSEVAESAGGMATGGEAADGEVRRKETSASRVLVDSAECAPRKPWVWRPDSAGLWRVWADRPNAARFDAFELSIEGADGVLVRAGRVEAKTFIDQCEDVARGRAVALPLRFDQLFGTPMRPGIAYPVRCRYEAAFDIEHLPDACFLMRDAGAISGVHTMRINDSTFEPEMFEPRFVYDHRNVACDVRGALRLGRNTIAVDITVEHDWDGVVDALYLCGDFGVSSSGRGESGIVALTVPPDTAHLRGGVIGGFPFFAGTLTFARTATIDALPGDTDCFELRFADWDETIHDAVEVSVNGVSLGVRPWTPYVWSSPVALLREGANEIEVKVTNTLIGLLEGKTFDYKAHVLLPALQP